MGLAADLADPATDGAFAPPDTGGQPDRLDPLPLLRRARGLLLFHGVREAAPLRAVVALLRALAASAGSEGRGALGDGGDVAEAYGTLFRALVESAAPFVGRPASPTGDPLRTGIVHALALDENLLSRAAAGSGIAVAPALRAAAAADLRVLQDLAVLGPLLPPAVAATGADEPPLWPRVEQAGQVEPAATSSGLSGMAGSCEATEATEAEPHGRRLIGLIERFLAAPDWGELVDDLVAHNATNGSGLFARHRAFRWEGALIPVPRPDAIRADQLVGYEAERALLHRNTAHFLAGYPANNVLLYGDRGTVKSSSIKALLNERPIQDGGSDEGGTGGGDRGIDGGEGGGRIDWAALRLIEVPKSRLADFPALVALLRDRPQRFILFVDDLSYEEGETQYKDLKAILEGGLEARPENVVVYATSNRRHLIREQFADRTRADSDEIHARDTVQEKLSFSDRFGITITFPSPDQASYLAIVEGLARQRALPIAPAALRARAIEWAAWHNGRSGRTAKQFVDYLAGELGLGAA
jgi:predicted AAA+ superfamily ATPase